MLQLLVMLLFKSGALLSDAIASGVASNGENQSGATICGEALGGANICFASLNLYCAKWCYSYVVHF